MSYKNNNELKNLLTTIRSAVFNDKKYITFPKKKIKYFQLLSLLQKNGLIYGFEERGNFIVLHFRFNWSVRANEYILPFHVIQPIKRINRHGTMQSRSIIYHKKIKGPFEFFYISTDKGVVLGSDGICYKSGGVPLFEIK